MNKTDLKYGNVVETRNCGKYLFTYHDEEDIFVDLNGDGYYYFSSLNFNNNYKNSDIVIMKVYKDYTLKELLWERKEKPKLTDDEKVILRNIDKDYKWIARDRGKYLYVYENMPFKSECMWYAKGDLTNLHIFKHLFRFIQWEDKKPYLIEDLLKGDDENE